MVYKPTHISGSLMYYVHIKKALIAEFFTNVGTDYNSIDCHTIT